MDVLIIADDLTGALDTASQFGDRTYVLLDYDFGLEADYLAVSTDTRLVSPEKASLKVRRVLNAGFSFSYLYKKTDSTMRGNVGAELGEISSSLDENIPFTPAFPEQGRIVVDGILYVQDKLLEETHYVKELPIRSSNLVDIVRATTNVKVDYWGGNGDILIFRDIRSRSDLSAAFDSLIDRHHVMGGSAGLAIELSKYLGTMRPQKPEAGGPILIVSGSENEVTRRQLGAISEHLPVLSLDSFGIMRAKEMLRRKEDVAVSFSLSSVSREALSMVSSLLTKCPVGGLIVVGGETLRSLLNYLGVKAIKIGESPEIGLAGGWIMGGALDGTPIVSKAGGFGSRDTLINAWRWLKRS